MTEVADLYVVLRSVGTKFEEGMARAGASAGAAESKIAGVTRGVRTMAMGAAAGGLLVAGAALKMSSEFDRAMEQIHTLAHVPQSDLKQLSAGVLDVAGKVGLGPTSLADALYHIESSFASVGITGKKALDLLKTAAEGAQIGNADLVDVTNALDAAIASGIPGVQNMNDAMGALLATIGAGDMKMQDLADALGTGILVVGKQYGATLADIGAGLATLGDNNIRGAKAATELRMAIQDLALQSDKSAKFLQSHLHIDVGQLAKDLQRGGLRAALEDLHHHLDALGIKGTEIGQVLGQAFTKKSSAPLAILLGQLDRLNSKYPELAKGAHSFGDSWQKTSELIALKSQEAKAHIEAAFIGLGHMLQPIAAKILDVFNGAFEWAKTHKKTVQEIAHALQPVLVGALVIVGGLLASMAIEAAIAAAPFLLLAAAVGLAVKWFMNLYEHNAKVREFVQQAGNAIRKDLVAAFQEAKRVVGEVIDFLVGFYHRHHAAIQELGKNAMSVLKDLWGAFQQLYHFVGDVIRGIIAFYEKHKKTIDSMYGDVLDILNGLAQAFQDGFDAVRAIVQTAVKIIKDLWDRFGEHLWSHVVTAWHAIVQVVKGALQIVRGIFQMITGLLTGNWSKFWDGLKNVVGGAWKVIVGVVKTAVNLLSTVIGAAMAAISAAWDLIWHTLEHVAENAWRGIEKVAKAIYHWFAHLGGDIVGFFKDAGSWLLHAGESIVTGLIRGIGKDVHVLWTWASKLPQQLFDALDKIYDNMVTVGKNVVIGIWNGIAGMAKWLWNRLESFLESIWNDIKDFFGISSPSRLMKETVGKHIVTGIAEGILENRHHVHKALKKLADETARTRINVGSVGYGRGDYANGDTSGIVGQGTRSGGVIFNVTVQGQLVDTMGFFKAMQTAAQQHGARNPGNGLSFSR